MNDETFTLCNDPPPPARFDDQECRQTVLFAGLDALPGQEDLFPTDGEHETQG